MAPQRNTPKQQGNAAAIDSSAGGPEAPSAEAAPPQPDAAEMAWPLLLQHDSVRTQLPLVCKLLCCSKAVAAVVAEHCAGRLDIPWEAANTAQAKPAVAWVCKHVRLVRSLDLRLDNPATSDIAAALMTAGQQQQTLALQSLQAFSMPTTLPLLEQLPASPLTHLKWWLREKSVQPPDRPALVARVSAALGRLTALQSLQLDRGPEGRPSHQLGLSGLSALTQLTSLDFKGPLADLQHAPPQLLELDISDAWRQPGRQPLELENLAAVTALSCLGVQEGDALPPNLLKLQADDSRTVQPLLCLEQLQQLDLSCSAPGDPTAGQLQQLSRLTALSMNYSHYNGRYSRQCIEPASAAAWPLLPLQRLGLRHAQLSAPVCQHLAQLSGLASLRLKWCDLSQPDSAQQLAAVLRQLSRLQQLELPSPEVAAAGNTTAEPSQGMQQLAQAIGSLQCLRELDISRLPQLAAAAGASNSLSSLVLLTALSLANCCWSDAAVAAIVSQLPGLQSLACTAGNTEALPAIARLQLLTCLVLTSMYVLSDACLQQLCAGLTRLRRLSLDHRADVTDTGMCHLTGLVWLQELRVPRCVSQQRRRWLKQRLPDLAKLE